MHYFRFVFAFGEQLVMKPSEALNDSLEILQRMYIAERKSKG